MGLVENKICWLNSLIYTARFYGIAVSEENMYADSQWSSSGSIQSFLESSAQKISMSVDILHLQDTDLQKFPLLVELRNVGVAFVEESEGILFTTEFTKGENVNHQYCKEEFFNNITGFAALVRPLANIPDPRIDEYIKPYKDNWFRNIVLRDHSRYGDVVMASLVANILALSSMIFSMQIYDRVIPAQSENTLWVLFAGVMIALAFEFFLRTARVVITDCLGKKADLRLSDYVFGRAIRIKNTEKPRSTGTFIAQIRELEQVREMITSNVISVMADLPFILLFLFVLWLIGGKLVLVVLAAIPVALIPAVMLQKKFALLAREGMRESTLRNCLLVEVVQGSNDIKLMRAEARFEHLWRNYNEFLAEIGLKQRFIAALLLNGFAELQSLVYVCVLLCGSYFVMAGEITTGALIGSSILSSRIIASIIRTAQILSRWQQTKVSYESLDNLVKKKVDYTVSKNMLQVGKVDGRYEIQNVRFHYGEENMPCVINIEHLQINAGERIAILGKIGAGKSTFLQLMAGLVEPQEGIVTVDGLNLALIDVAVVRRDVGLLQQDARLFFGSIRENLILGRPGATDTEILDALKAANALQFVQSQPSGLDYIIMEGGLGLSGGQKQALLLARLLLTQPKVLLLDEPTSSLDPNTEQHVLEALDTLSKGKTMILATHKMSLLRIVERIIVLDKGKIVLDGPKDKILKELSGGQK